MRTQSRRRSGWAAAWALAIVAGAPTLARAQQSGLFPLHPIKRERIPCPAEDPVYRLYREQYFGYHPTLWRRFPSGWGMPSPEAPNPAESYRLIPRDVPPDANANAPDAGDEPAPRPGPGGAAMPDDAGGAAPVPGTPNPNSLPPLPSGERSPFDLDSKDPKPNPPPRSTTPRDGRNAPPPEGAGVSNPLPELPSAGGEGPAPAPAAASVPAREGQAESPLLALPDPTVATVAGPNAGQPSQMTPLPAAPAGERTGSPFQAPRRTSLLGGLFSGLRRR